MFYTPPVGTKVLWETDRGPYLPAELHEGRIVDHKTVFSCLIPGNGMVMVAPSIFAAPRAEDCHIVSVRKLVW